MNSGAKQNSKKDAENAKVASKVKQTMHLNAFKVNPSKIISASSSRNDGGNSTPNTSQSPSKQKAAGMMSEEGDPAEVDEMGTIHLIESLDPEAKKVLNSLVQSVLIT